MTPHPVTVYIHGPDLSLCYPLMWNITLEYTTTHFNVLGKSFPNLPHTPANAQLYDTNMVVASRELGIKYRTNRVLNLLPMLPEFMFGGCGIKYRTNRVLNLLPMLPEFMFGGCGIKYRTNRVLNPVK